MKKTCIICGLSVELEKFVVNKNRSSACDICRWEKVLIRDFNTNQRFKAIKHTTRYRERKKELKRIYRKISFKTDPLFKLKSSIRTRIYKYFKKLGGKKRQGTESILGCNFLTLKAHLESKFLPGMGWDNMGMWHIDHKQPLATAETETDVVKLNHYTNLQPLWAADNIKKGATYVNA